MIANLDLENNIEKGLEVLTNRNKTFSLLVKQLGKIEFTKRQLNFESLIRVIINQQLSNHLHQIEHSF